MDAKLAMFAARQLVNEHVLRLYAASLCGLIGIFIVSHWTRWLGVRVKLLGPVTRPLSVLSRATRNILVRRIPGFSSAGHALLVAAYVAANASLAFYNVNSSSIGNYGSRFGWMAIANMCFLVFLALKNTPLAFLTAYSYERLNGLHQVAGYTMFVFMVLHAAMYTSSFQQEGTLQTSFAESVQIAGIIAGFSFFSVVFAGAILRRIWYELFLVVHITFWIVGVIAIGNHQPSFTKPILIITLLAASMWFVDRLVRGARIVVNAINNEATLHPLPNGGTKILMKKSPWRAVAGKHCFVWIPAVRPFETHPFTIVSTSPLEFTVKAHDGFTRGLHEYAKAHPGAAVRASVDGPYGTFPDPMDYNKVVLIAGGGGATFTFGMAVNILERMKDDTETSMVFIWAVKEHENLSWFEEHLHTLTTHAHAAKVNISLYVTSPPPSHHHHRLLGLHSTTPPRSVNDADVETSITNLPSTPSNSSQTEITQEKQSGMVAAVSTVGTTDATTASPPPSVSKGCTEAATAQHHVLRHIKPGRPDVATLIREAVGSTPKDQRVLVAGCGPDGLMHMVRDTTATLIRADGPSVELHCEQFGW